MRAATLAGLSLLSTVSISGVASSQIIRTTGRPDLDVVGLTVPTPMAPGVTFTITVTVRNGGTVEASSGWYAQLVLSPDSAITSLDKPLGNRIAVPVALAVGAVHTVRPQITLPATLAAGSQYVGVILDVTGVVTETSEGNNMEGRVTSIVVPATPNVTSLSDPFRGQIGDTLRINGLSLIPSFFTARIGTQQLQVLSGTSTVISVRLPAATLVGDLVVSHGTPATEYIARSGYVVYGAPVIASVQPSSFRSGQTVTVTGSNLFAFNIGPYTYTSLGTTPFVLIGGTVVTGTNGATALMNYTSVRVANWTASADGKSAAFTALDVWTNGVLASPQPTAVTGTLALHPQSTFGYDLLGPNVSWAPAPVTITALTYPQWTSASASVTPPFVLTDYHGRYQPKLSIQGSGLSGASGSLGTTAVALSPSTDGTTASFHVPYGAPSAYVVATKGSERAQSAQVANVLPGPRIDEQNSDTVLKWGFVTVNKLKVDSVYMFRGWDLKPAGASGLTVRLDPGIPSTELQNCGLALEVMNHADNMVAFRFAKKGTIPTSCLSSTLFQGSLTAGYKELRMLVSYGGVDRYWWQRAYALTQ